MRFTSTTWRQCVERLVLGRRPVPDAGVVHEHVDAVERSTASTRRSQSASTATSHATGTHPVAELGGEGLEAVEPAGGDDDGGPGGVQHPGEAVAEAGRRAGDHRDLAVEGEHRSGGIHGCGFW